MIYPHIMRTYEENPVQNFNLADLLIAFQRVLRRAKARTVMTKITRDEFGEGSHGASDGSAGLAWRQGMFSSLIEENAGRTEIVVTFLAILELIRRKFVTCYQHQLFEDIVIQLRVSGGYDEIPADEISY